MSIPLSARVQRVRVSGTVKFAQLARSLKAQGVDVIELSEGEPDFETPAHVVTAAFDAARQGQTRYTEVAGTPELRRAIVEKFERGDGISYAADEIIVGVGAKQLIFNAFLATLDPGNEVIIPAPYWVSYPDMVRIADGQPVIVLCRPDAGYKLTPQQLSSAITEDTRWLILNSPGNPSGAVYSADELGALANVLRQHPHVAVMSDDIYEKIVFDGHAFATMAGVAPDLKDRLLTVNGVSKSYAMTGWRIGYAGGPKSLIDAMAKLQGQSTTNASSVSQAAALEALTGTQEFLDDWLAAYTKRRAHVAGMLSEIPGLRVAAPEGAIYFFVGCDEYFGCKTPAGTTISGSNDFCLHLLEAARVGVVPGAEFGMEGYFRLCFAKSEEELVEACTRIAEACSHLTRA